MTINSTKILVFLLVGNVVLTLLYIGSQLIQKLEYWFDVNAEANLPTWYSGVILLLIAFPAGIRAWQLRQENRESHWRIYAMAVGTAVFLSADEIGTVHETLNMMLSHRLPRIELPTGRNAAGLFAAVLYGIVGLILLLWLRRDLYSFLKERRGRATIVGGAAMIVIAGVVVDNFMPYKIVVLEHALEEFLEMTGATLILHGFLRKLDSATFRFC